MRAAPVILVLLMATIFVVPARGETLKIACYRNYHPYAFVEEDGSHEGLLIDYWRVWSRINNTPVEFIAAGFDDAISVVTSDKADMLCGTFTTEQNNQSLLFTDSVMRMRGILFARDDQGAESLADIAGPIGVVENHFSEQFLAQHHPQQPRKLFPNFTELRQAVRGRTIGAFVYDYPSRLLGSREFPSPDGYTKVQELYSQRMRAAVNGDDESLRASLNAGIVNVPDSEMMEVIEQYEFYSYTTPDRTTAIVILSGLLALLLGAVVYIATLKKRLWFVGQPLESDWRALLRGGETERVEFKSSYRWDLRQEKVNKVLETVIAKTISAFLNSDGGTLFIGVDDEGQLLGLENDYQSFSKKNRDGLMLALSSLVNKSLGKTFHRFVSIHIEAEGGKDVCIVHVSPASEPAFLTAGGKDEFYIRAQASSVPMGVKDSHAYILAKWKPSSN